jgi:hypothetical protein
MKTKTKPRSYLGLKKLVLPLLQEEFMQHIMIKLLLECWNANTPHFGGDGPHRYDGKDRKCAYCSRPKDWVNVNPGVAASEILYGSEES